MPSFFRLDVQNNHTSDVLVVISSFLREKRFTLARTLTTTLTAQDGTKVFTFFESGSGNFVGSKQLNINGNTLVLVDAVAFAPGPPIPGANVVALGGSPLPPDPSAF